MPRSPGPPHSRPLDITVAIQDHHAVLALSGEIDASNAPDIVLHADQGLGQPGVSHLTADLSGVIFIDSSGIQALVFCRGHALRQGKTFQIEGQRGQVAKILEAVGIAELLTNPAFTTDPP